MCQVILLPVTTISASMKRVIGVLNEKFIFRIDLNYTNWFRYQFNTSLVDSITSNEQNFVFVNSMAFEGDGCQVCQAAETQLDFLSSQLNKLSHRPVVFLHYPFYR